MSRNGKYSYGGTLPELENEYFRTFESSILDEIEKYKGLLQETDYVEEVEGDVYFGSPWNYC